MVTTYREERQRREIEAENVSLGYDTEYKEWVADHPLPTFKQWLKQSKRPDEMPEQEFRASWKGKAERDEEVAKAQAQWAADRKDEAAAEAAEMRRYLADDHDLPTLQQVRDYNETGLLGAAMVSDEALPALRTVRNEFSDVFHENVGKAILDQAADGAPHDAATVEVVLRERGQLTIETDTQYPMRVVDPAEYGLGSWERGANPADANALAQAIRGDYRSRYLAGVGERLQQSALAAAEAGEDPGLAFSRSANELVSVPPRLDLDLREIRNTATLEAVDTTRPVRVAAVRSEATTLSDLGLPPKPVLQTVPRIAASA